MFFTVCVHSVLVLMRRTIEIELNGFWNNYHPRWFLLKSFSVQCSKIEPENVEIFFPYLQFTLNSITVAVGNKEGWEESLVVLQNWGHYKECGMSLTNNHNYAEKNANKWVRNYFFFPSSSFFHSAMVFKKRLCSDKVFFIKSLFRENAMHRKVEAVYGVNVGRLSYIGPKHVVRRLTFYDV